MVDRQERRPGRPVESGRWRRRPWPRGRGAGDEHRHVARHEVEDDFIFGTVADHYGHPFQPLAVGDAAHHAFQQRLSA